MIASASWRRHQQTVSLALVAVLVALACVALSRWQWHRFEDKRHKKQLVERNYDAPAVPLKTLLRDAAAPFDPTLQWRPVRVTGHYDPSATTLVRNRPRDVDGSPAFGYEVLVPLVQDDGSALLVDRGWVPSGTSGANPGERPDSVPAPPTGPVQVVARLRSSEPRRDARAPAGQVGSIAVPQVARITGRQLLPAYAALVSESPAPATAPARLGRPQLDGGEGINASYAVQWIVFALLALGFPFWFTRRQRRAAEQPEPRPGEPVVVATRRRRIWDDEDE